MNPPASPTSVRIRFCGDTSDGMHQIGVQFASVCETTGYRTHSRPIPAGEIRAPVGTLAGVSGYEVCFSSLASDLASDRVQTLVALNPAALAIHLTDLEPGGVLIVDREGFTPDELAKARYYVDPLTDGSLAAYRVLAVPARTRTRESVAGGKISPREAERGLNFFILGLVCWLYERPLEPTQKWLRERFTRNPLHAEACLRVLKAGHHYGDTATGMPARVRLASAPRVAGHWRRITGTDALVLGFAAAAERTGRGVVFSALPMPPATTLLEKLTDCKRWNVVAVQAEDDPAAVGIAVGASFGGSIGATASSGPGIGLQSEGIGLAVMAELPLIAIHVQRAGPSTGIPTLSEQADLLHAMYGRNGESPLPILAPMSPVDHFPMLLEAVRIATRFMTPVILLTDGDMLAHAEPWKIPDQGELPDLTIAPAAGVRVWRIPGGESDSGVECLSGSEKDAITGEVSHDAANHARRTEARAARIESIASTIPPAVVEGVVGGELLVIGWGATDGAVRAAVEAANAGGRQAGYLHLRYLNPFPANLGEVLRGYAKYLVVERNRGQLAMLLRSRYLIDAKTVGAGEAAMAVARMMQ